MTPAKTSPIKKDDLLGLLYLINKSGEFFSHRIRLQKMVLLAKYEFAYPFSYSYVSYYYGPYSRDLQNNVADLVREGLIKEEIRENINSSTFHYSLTKNGREFLKGFTSDSIDKLWEKYSKSTTDYIVKSAKAVSNLKSLNER